MTTYEVALPEWLDGVLEGVVPEGVDREAWMAYQVQKVATEGALQEQRERLQRQAQAAANERDPQTVLAGGPDTTNTADGATEG